MVAIVLKSSTGGVWNSNGVAHYRFLYPMYNPSHSGLAIFFKRVFRGNSSSVESIRKSSIHHHLEIILLVLPVVNCMTEYTMFPCIFGLSSHFPLIKDASAGKAKSVFHWLARFHKRGSCF